MEGAVIGYVPYVQPAKSSSIPECYQESSFIHLPRSVNVPNSVEENKMLNNSSPDVNNKEDLPVELTSNLNEDRKRLPLKGKSNAMSGKSELPERKSSSDETSLDMRLVVDEINSDPPIELSSVQNGDKGQRVSLKRSASELKPEQASQSKKLCVERGDDSNASLVYELGNSDPGSDSLDKICPQASVLGLSAMNASTSAADSSDLSPRSSPVDLEASESAGKKRYLFDFRPNTHQIIVKSKSGEKSFKCFVCGAIYQQKFSLKRHYLRTHIDFRYISENDISNCNIPVPYYIKKLHSNLDYKKSSNGRKKFKKSNSDIFLDNNDRCLMPGLYRCHDCPNITCDTETELKDHYNKHPESIKKKFHCEVCDASFFKKQILSRHLASHGKKKVRFECKKCNIDFPSQAELLRHANSHNTGKACKFCGKSLSTSANRKRHEALHLGLKPHKCIHCGTCFAQSKDLDRHLRKQHSELCRECPLCSKLFPTTENLDIHIHDKHGDSSAKAQETSNNLGNAVKDGNIRLPGSDPSVPAVKTKCCTVCKRPFNTMYAMLKHKRQAHPYHSRKKKRVKQKVRRGKEVASNLEFRKSYSKPHGAYAGHPESPAKRGRPIQKPTKDSEKYAKRNGRPGPRSISKKEEESFKEFYNNVAYQINKNIIHHVDGRATQLSLKQYNFSDCPYSSEFFEDQGRLPWSHYNFPQWYDVDNALKTRGQEIKRPENLSSQDEFLYDATGLAPSQRAANSDSQASKKTEAQVTDACEQNEQMTLEGKKKLIGKEVISLILCSVCRETFNSHEDYEQHIINNHPNVECHFTVFEGDKEKPPVVPSEMRQMHLSPTGYRFSCDVPPSAVEVSMKCTKCKSEFPTRPELHSHLTQCGNLKSSSSGRVWKPKLHKRIKNTMKNRMSPAQQQATLNAEDYRTPEKQESKPNGSANSAGKTPKSTEKLQFYKSGRLQTTSLTVDMNYFNTKPTKPAKSVSKRGRKSYALVSSMYRNATMQPSTSRECPDCRVVFPSLAALNQHLKSHYPESTPEKTDELNKVPADDTSDRSNGSFSINANRSQNAPEQFKMTAHVRASLSPEFPRSHSNVLPSLPTIGSITDDVLKDSAPTATRNHMDSSNIQPVDIPIDLSTNSCDRNKETFNQNTVNKKSALQIAMDAVLEFSENSETGQKTKNLHISKLQETVEKLTQPTISPLSKPIVARKVGRPRKLKNDSPPPPLQNCNSGLLGSGTPTKSKPTSKLEETVERLKSKVSSQEKNRQNSAVAGASMSDKGGEFFQNEKRSEISTLKDSCQSNLPDHKEKPKTVTANNSGTHENTSTNFKTNDDDNNNSKASISTVEGVSDICSQTSDESVVKDKTGNQESSDTSEKTELTENITPVENQELQKINFEEDRAIQGLSSFPSSEFSIPERPEKTSQSTHGRSSPTLDSLLKVITQKLHSEEEESSQHDDTAITWLEDEKFEIPPPRSNLNIMVNANSNMELVPAECNIPPNIDISNSDLELRPSALPENSDKAASESSNSINETVEIFEHRKDSPKKVTSISDSSDIQTSPKVQTKVQKEIPKSPAATVSDPSVSNLGTVAEKSLDKSSSPSDTPKELKNSSEGRPHTRRGPGRPRKKLLENIDTVIHASTKKDSTPSSEPSEVARTSPIEKNAVSDSAPLKDGDVSNEVISSNESGRKKSHITQDISKSSNETLSAKSSENKAHSSKVSNSDEPHNVAQMEQPAVSALRTYRTKAKQIQSDTSTKSNFPLKNNITTEFGKSLASKMKEKMRLSFEQESSKNAAKAEEPVASVSSSTCDSSSQPKEKLKAVKKECDTAEPTKIHSCPYCMLEFAYLTNFRRHLKACLARTESKETDSTPGNSATNLQHLPKKDEVDYSMLNLYRHQSRQTQMLKEVEKNLGSDTPIKKYECTVCHRIYLNLFTFLQHKITQHNLAPQSSSEANASNDSPSCPSEMNDISSTFASESTSDLAQQDNGLKLRDSVNYESFIDNFISEQSNESAVDDPPASDFKEDDDQVDGTTNETECPTLEAEDPLEVTDESQLADLPGDSNDNESVKDDEKTPAKRKRGRPFGWRKNVTVAEENKNSAEPKKETHNSNKNSALIYKRAGRINSSASEATASSKLKGKAKKALLNKVEKTVTRAKSVVVDEKETDPADAARETKAEKSGTQSSLSAVKEELKDSPKLSVMNDSELTDDDFVDLKMDKISKLSNKAKNASPVDADPKNKTMKRGRGRPPVLTPVSIPKTPSPEPGPLKRRPGRPPKNLQVVAGPSQPLKHSANALPPRSGRKAVQITVDSSDSECDVVETDIPIKKKVGKFSPELPHGRRMQPAGAANKAELSNKVSKKSTPKSPIIDASEDDSETVTKRSDDVASKKSPNQKTCSICKGKFDSLSQLRHHIQTFHSRKSEPTAGKLKIPSEAPESDSNRPVTMKNKKVENFNRSSLTRQCRKSLPLLQKRVKKQSPEQVKRQKL